MASKPKLREYQEQAADFIYERDRSQILAKVGAGKTAIAATAMQDLLIDGLVTRWLVLAPKRVATDVWPVELDKWTPDVNLSVAVGTPAERLRALRSGSHVMVTNYDNLQWLCEQKLNFDGIVCDELTRLKNPSGARAKALHSVLDQINIRIGLTGSFTSNGLEDVFGQCKVIDDKLLGRAKGAFLQQYFVLINRDFGEWEPRPGALARVMERIKPATFLLESKEYADTLPPLHTVEVRCDLYDREPYETMKKHFVLELAGKQITAASAGAATNKLQQLASGWVYESHAAPDLDKPGKFIETKVPHWCGSHKFDRLDDLLEENQREPTILWYWYQETFAELKRRYPDALTLDDKDVVKKWNTGKHELLLAHPASAGHGLNLQAGGSSMVFMELPWSLELYEQAVGRLHRSGQKHEVWVYVLLTNKTIDEQIWAAIDNKKGISEIAVEALKNS